MSARRASVSVICPVFQQADLVAHTIRSVREQTFEDWELIAIDDGSTDDSAEIVRDAAAGDARISIHRFANAGVTTARARGFALASAESEYLLFLDGDDALAPTMLERLSSYLDRHPEVGVAYCQPAAIDGDGNPVKMDFPPRYEPHGLLGVREIPPTRPDTPLGAILTYAFIAPSVALLRRSVFEAAGGWEPGTAQYYEDTDLFLRMRLKAPVHFVPEQLVSYRWHAAQASASAAREGRQRQRLLERWETRRSNEQVRAGFNFLRRQHAWRTARITALTKLRERRAGESLRFLLGGARNLARSWMTDRRPDDPRN